MLNNKVYVPHNVVRAQDLLSYYIKLALQPSTANDPECSEEIDTILSPVLTSIYTELDKLTQRVGKLEEPRFVPKSPKMAEDDQDFVNNMRHSSDEYSPYTHEEVQRLIGIIDRLSGRSAAAARSERADDGTTGGDA